MRKILQITLIVSLLSTTLLGQDSIQTPKDLQEPIAATIIEDTNTQNLYTDYYHQAVSYAETVYTNWLQPYKAPLVLTTTAIFVSGAWMYLAPSAAVAVVAATSNVKFKKAVKKMINVNRMTTEATRASHPRTAKFSGTYGK